jgi:hypothetical protein
MMLSSGFVAAHHADRLNGGLLHLLEGFAVDAVTALKVLNLALHNELCERVYLGQKRI